MTLVEANSIRKLYYDHTLYSLKSYDIIFQALIRTVVRRPRMSL
jgi:hypothetical protein